jgi:hypothetical protein
MKQCGQCGAFLALFVLPCALVYEGEGEPAGAILRLIVSSPQKAQLEGLEFLNFLIPSSPQYSF